MELLKQIFLSCLPQIFQAQPLLSTSLTCFLVASILLMSIRYLKKESRIWSCLLHRLQVCVAGCCCTLKVVVSACSRIFYYHLSLHLLSCSVYSLKQLLMPHPSTQWKVWMTHPLSSAGADHRLQSQVCPTGVHLFCLIGRIWNVGEKGNEI